MKGRFFTLLMALVAIAVLIAAPWQAGIAQESPAQIAFIKHGVKTQGFGIQQVGELSTLTAAVASATLTEVVAAPASGSIYLRGIWIEKMTATTGSVTVRYGTGTNCGTGTTTLLTIGPQTATSLVPVGYYPVGALVPSGKALCLVTDASTTSARALAN